MTLTPQQATALRDNLCQMLLDQLPDALLQCSSVEHLNIPILRLEAFIQDGYDGDPGITNGEPPSRQPIISRLIDLSHFMGPSHSHEPHEAADNSGPHARLSPAHLSKSNAHDASDGIRDIASVSPDHFFTPDSQNATNASDPGYRNTRSMLRPSRDNLPVQDSTDSQRQIQICDRNFPKRTKTRSTIPLPQESSLGKLIVGIWDHVHSGIDLEPRNLVEQWQLTASLTTTSLTNTGYLALNDSGVSLPTSPPSASYSPAANFEDRNSSFSENSAFCRKITQASRTCRSVEVIVQARWIEHFDAHVEFIGSTNPDMSPTKCRKAALVKACSDFGWLEKELRNKMLIWRGYKEIKDAGGWAALVFAGMGLYRFCKYRVGFTKESMQRLRTLRLRFEVAADTLHPNWRQLLGIVGEHSAQTRFSGHPHDWVVHTDGSEPVPLASTYLNLDPYFNFDHIDESVIDVNVWGADDPCWVLPPRLSTASTAIYKCAVCGMEQDDDLKRNNCYCYPSLFGGPRSRPPVQVFHTTNGKRNGVQALVPFQRGTAIGEFVGLVTKGIQDSDVMMGSVGEQEYQIWQGTQGNFTRFVNHSCKADAQFQPFVWKGTQRILLVSKGIEAGKEITVDYSRSYWRGLDKRCLCGETCCRYNGERR